MATQQVAWTVDGFNNLAVLYPNFQTAPYTADLNIIDLTISKSETVMLLTLDGEETIIHYAKETFPLDWGVGKINFSKIAPASDDSEEEKEVVEVTRIDASPDNTLYLVLNSGRLAKVSVPDGKNTEVEAELVEGIENVSQVSAAPDGLVWVVNSDGMGSHVSWMDPKNGKWNQVTGGPKGKAYIINSANALANYTKKGAKTDVPCDFPAKGLSIGPDGRLWVMSINTAENLTGGSAAYWTDNEGKNWTEVPGSNVTNLDAGIIQSDFN